MAIGSIALILAACGGENVNQTGGDDDSSVDDSEAVAISLDSLVGYSQKGPFLKGSTVYLYELSDGKTLKQTSGNFTSIISRDDGRYKFSARDLASQYAMLVVDGYYRNEVTGESSNAPIRLRALTDMRKRSSANVNLLTHLEYDRVYNLVTREHKTVKAAKKQAQAEIFNAFHIDTTGFSESSEDLDVFGSSEADAALLAISILLQGDRTESELTALLAELSDDLSDGKWDDAEKRAEIADWALGKIYYSIRHNVENWELTTIVPHFEKYIRRFASLENGLGLCGSDSTPVRTVKQVMNSKSRLAGAYYACVNADSAKWRQATNLDKEIFYWNPENSKDGSIVPGKEGDYDVVWDADTLRYAHYNESYLFKKGCVSYIRGSSFESNLAHYDCTAEGWKLNAEKSSGTVRDAAGQEYRTIAIGFQNWMAENLNYKVESSVCYNAEESNCTKYGRLYTWMAATTVCPSGWHLPDSTEWETLFKAVRGSNDADKMLLWSVSGFSVLPAGFSYGSAGFYDEGNRAYFWSSTEDGNYASYMRLDYGYGFGYLYYDDKYRGFSVRCLQD